MKATNYRALILTVKGMKPKEIEKRLGVPIATAYSYRKKIRIANEMLIKFDILTTDGKIKKEVKLNGN